MSRPEPRPVSWHELNRIRGRAVATATGTVLEVGAGSGDNFAHFAHDVTWIGLEPHAKSRAALERTAHALGTTVPFSRRPPSAFRSPTRLSMRSSRRS